MRLDVIVILSIAPLAGCGLRRRPPPPAIPPASAVVATDSAPTWPRTVADAAAMTINKMSASERSDLRRLTRDQVYVKLHGFQMSARHEFGLQEGNVPLLRSCGSETMVLEDCLLVILEAAWQSLQRR